MTSHKVDELPSDTKDLSSVADHIPRHGSDGITEEIQSEPVNTTVKPQKPGKFRRTALTFFGVRKSICILPSFFGGRNKNQGKKGICKSRTHDGLSKVSHDDAVSTGDFEFHSQRDAAGDLHSSCHNECSHPAADQKSLTLGRQRKGLRSLFQSFKQHRSQRNAELDKTETTSSQCRKEVPVVQHNTKQYAAQCLRSEPNAPDIADVMCNNPVGLECSHEDTKELKNCSEIESPKSKLDVQVCDDQTEEMNLVADVSGDYKETSRRSSEPCLKLQMSEAVLKSQTPASSSDQLNQIFGDVASLKSFDSLTGCGDIIADQEDESFTESSVSGERSRNRGKRASCCLTYQGGGEEMASPEELDKTCLQDFWGNNATEEVCCACDVEQTDVTTELTSSHNMDVLNSSSAQQASGLDSSSITDVLSPQSEHQESVPNSDEGYYDSMTPGPDEGQEKSDRLLAARLPRDSYSGDALYELFAPDEGLMSPHYENKSQLLSSKHSDYLTEPVKVTDLSFVPGLSRLQISAEMYKDDFLEMPSTCSKSSVLAQNVVGLQEIKVNKNCNLNNIKPDAFNDKGNTPDYSEKRTKSVNIDNEKKQRSLSFGNTSDPDFETFCEAKEEHLEENIPVALPYKNINCQSEDSNSYVDDGQTVCFSQALVDYTKHAQTLSDSETDSTFTPNMEALPTIVTFDVVDMHNEGEYDEQIHMELEEDTSSPFQDFEESYLQKDAFADCDYQMLELYEQNLISNTWGVASLPQNLVPTKVSQSVQNPLSLGRRSRSLDTESLERKIPDTHVENRAATVSCPQTEQNSERDCSPYYKKNVVLSASEAGDSNSIMALSWQTRSEMALSLPSIDGQITEKVQHNCSPNSNFLKSKSQHCCSDPSDNLSCDLVSQNEELYSRQCHLPLCSDSCLPHSTFVYSGLMEEDSDDADIFCKAPANFQSYNQGSKGRSLVGREGVSCNASLFSAGVSQDDMAVLGESKTSMDMKIPVACSEHPEATCD